MQNQTLLNLIFSEVKAIRLCWFLGALVLAVIVEWQMGGSHQHTEPLRGSSPFVAGRRAPVGYVGVEGALPPLEEPYPG